MIQQSALKGLIVSFTESTFVLKTSSRVYVQLVLTFTAPFSRVFGVSKSLSALHTTACRSNHLSS